MKKRNTNQSGIAKKIFLLIFFLFMILILTSNGMACPNTNSKECGLPPFWSNNISPNVLLVIDESGSMQFPGYFSCDWQDYSNFTANCGEFDSDETPSKKYDIHKLYYGYFKNDKLYKYDSADKVFRASEYYDCNASQLVSQKVCSLARNIECDSDSNCTGAGKCIYAIGGGECIAGNLLNWATMSRTDLLRKALIGGKQISHDDNSSVIRGEGGNWEFEDLDLMCKIHVQGADNNDDFAHTLTITGIGTNDDLRECGKLVVKSNGQSIWGTDDDFYFVYQTVSGDFDVRLKITKKPDETGTGQWAKTGLMVRSSLASDGKKLFEAVTRDHGLQFSYRPTDGSDTYGSQNNIAESTPIWLRIVRTGQTFKTYYSTDGNNWSQHSAPEDEYTFSEEPMPETLYIGIATASYHSGTVAIAKFDDFVCQSGNCQSDDFNDSVFHEEKWGTAHIGNEDRGEALQGCSRTCPVTINDAKVQVEIPTEDRRGVIQETLDKDKDGQIDANAPRIGLMVYSSGSSSSDWWTRHGCIRVGVDNTSLDALVQSLEQELPYSGTPTVYGIREADDYFSQQNSHKLCDNSAFIHKGTSIDPYYFDGSLISCRKSFVITVSDGEWNTGGDPVDEVHQTHINDLRSDIPGDQTLTHYTLFIFGSDGEGPRAMKNMAMYGGFNDLDGNDWPFDKTSYPSDSRYDDMTEGICQQQDRPRNCQEWDLNGDGLPDNYFLANNGKAIEQAFRKIFEDIQSNSGSAASVATVTQEVLGEDLVIRGAFTFYDDDPDIYTWRGHLEIYEPFFHCSDFSNRIDCEARGCTWDANSCTGRPDVNYDFELCSESSCPSQYCIDTGSRCVAKFCSDMTGTKHCLDAGQLLNERTSPRNIFTFVNGSQKSFEITPDANTTFWKNYLDVNQDYDGDGQYGTENDVSYLIQYIRGEINGNGTALRKRKDGWMLGDIIYSSPVVVGPPDENSVAPQIAHQDCEEVQPCFGFNEPETCNAHENDLGCFWSYYSNMCTSPDCEDMGHQICVNQPACQWDSQKNSCKDKNRSAILQALSGNEDKCFYSFRIHHLDRERVVYVGSNDGMLHAFSVQTGEELWAYIPSNLLSELKCLADPQYGFPGGCRHRYMVDLSPRVWNVKFKSDNKWHTVLVGGERGGGDVYFAIDVTEPREPKVLWEYSVFRNMALHKNDGSVTTPFTKARYISPYGDNLTLKTMPASWTEPAMAFIKIGGSVTFKAGPLISPLSDTQLSPGSFIDWQGPSLSDWFLIIGGSIRVFNNAELPEFLSDEEKQLIYKPYLLVIDIEKGVNIFQNLWPDLVNQAGIFSEVTNGGNTIPYALTTPLLLDTWDAKGCDYVNDSNASSSRKQKICQKAKHCTWSGGQCSGMLLGPDGYTDHIILGDLNGNLYNIKFNLSDMSSTFLDVEIHKTKKICTDTSDPQCQDLIQRNVFRSDRQPITIPPVASFDDVYNLRIFTGTGKLDDSYGGQDDSNDPATMSFYNLKEDSVRVDGDLTIASSYSTGFDINLKTLCQDAQLGQNCTWVKNGRPDCCEADCESACWNCVFDFIQPGERILYQPLVANGLVFLTTFVPNNDPCSAGGKGYLYILKYDCQDLLPDCSEKNSLNACTMQKSCFWDDSSSSCVGCEEFDSNATCSNHVGCKWISVDEDHESCVSKDDILSDSGLKSANGKNVSQLNTGEYTKIESKGYAVNLGPGVPSQPIYSQGKGNKASIFIQTSDAKIYKIDVNIKGKKILGISWDQNQEKQNQGLDKQLFQAN